MQTKVRSLRRGAALLIAAIMFLALPDGSPEIGPSSAIAQTIQSIEVEGNRRVDADTIRNYVTMQPGQGYSARAASESVQALFATGLFADVSIDMRASRLVVTVEENPILNEVAFEGNSELGDNTIRQAIESEPRGVFTRATVQNDVVRILRLYRRAGRFGARVEPQVIELPENRVNLVFEINEGDKTSVQRISFVGNEAFSDRNLRDVITTSERNWLSWLKSSDIYDPERLEADQELLRRHYLRYGYADFQVVSAVADFDRERNGFFITITVDEGEQYKVGDINVESYVPDVDPEQLRRLVRLRSGSIYNANEVDRSLEDMTFELANRGYAFAQVRPRGRRDFDNNLIHLDFVVEEGPRVYVERIEVRGNTRTLDTVVRRELDFAEGDAYNAVLVERAKRRLEQLRYFASIDISRQQGSAHDRVVVVITVEEEPTGEISVGGGYSTADGWLADVSLTERNLLGRGHILRIGGQLGQRSRGVDFSFTEPYFLGRRLAAGIDLFWREQDARRTTSFRSETIGGGVRLGFDLTDDLQMVTRYQVYRRKIDFDDSDNIWLDGCPPACGFDANTLANPGYPFGGQQWGVFAPEVSIPIKQAFGDRTYSAVGYDLTYSTLDSYTRPSDGFYLKFSQDVAGAGGDVNFVRSEIDGRFYHEVRPDLIAMLQARGGHIAGWGGDDVLVTDTFMLGGEIVRGFAPNGFGPRDLTPATRQESLGGKTYAAVTAELQFPIPLLPEELGFSGAFFADAGVLFDVGFTGNRTGNIALDLGNYLPECVAVSGRSGVAPPEFESIAPGHCYVDDTNLRASVGFSLLWESPFGPLRADVGYAFQKEDYDDTQLLRFGASRSF